MTEYYNFQLDIDDPSSWIMHYRLQNVFKHANPADPVQAFQAVQHVLRDANVVDHSQHENSPYRNRPAYLDSGKYDHLNGHAEVQPEKRPISDLPPKDWSVLGR
jgi:hypothetical protein